MSKREHYLLRPAKPTVYYVRVIADFFPPYRHISGLTDIQWSSYADARSAIFATFQGLKKRSLRVFESPEVLARWRGNGFIVEIYYEE